MMRHWRGRVAGVSVRRMRTRKRAYTRFTCATDSTTEDLLMRNQESLSKQQRPRAHRCFVRASAGESLDGTPRGLQMILSEAADNAAPHMHALFGTYTLTAARRGDAR